MAAVWRRCAAPGQCLPGAAYRRRACSFPPRSSLRAAAAAAARRVDATASWPAPFQKGMGSELFYLRNGFVENGIQAVLTGVELPHDRLVRLHRRLHAVAPRISWHSAAAPLSSR